MFPKFQQFKFQNGILVDGKAQLFYVRQNKKICVFPVTRPFPYFLGSKNADPKLFLKMFGKKKSELEPNLGGDIL